MTRAAKTILRRSLTLRSRQRLAVWAGRQAWLRDQRYLVFDLLADMAEADPDGFHRFLWSNHLAYAETYEIEHRLAGGALHATRYMLLEELASCLGELGRSPADIESVLDVGCSLGYVLRHLETSFCPNARRLDGIDIDAYAIAQGAAYLSGQGSRVRLAVSDVTKVDGVFGAEPYDVVLSAGVLMYAREAEAERHVAAMLARARRLLVLTGLAHPERDNSKLERSALRERDGTYIHNLDRMVRAAGGQVLRRRWEGARQVDGNTIYFVLASPAEMHDLPAAATHASATDTIERHVESV